MFTCNRTNQLLKINGTTIVMVLHDINLSARYADYIFGLRKGELIVEGSPSEVITSSLIKDIFDLDCMVIKDPVSGSPFAIPKGRYHTNYEFANLY